ncbi:MAG: glycosyltransferase family 4 protein, partial [Candidatus Limnocylindria bacterium]
MRILQVCAVDFTAYHMLRPLMLGCRDDGWTVEFACADGPWAALLRAEGFRHRRVPMRRSVAPGQQARATL